MSLDGSGNGLFEGPAGLRKVSDLSELDAPAEGDLFGGKVGKLRSVSDLSDLDGPSGKPTFLQPQQVGQRIISSADGVTRIIQAASPIQTRSVVRSFSPTQPSYTSTSPRSFVSTPRSGYAAARYPPTYTTAGVRPTIQAQHVRTYNSPATSYSARAGTPMTRSPQVPTSRATRTMTPVRQTPTTTTRTTRGAAYPTTTKVPSSVVSNYGTASPKYTTGIPQSGSYVASAGYPGIKPSGSFVAAGGSWVAPPMTRGVICSPASVAAPLGRSVSPQLAPRYPQLASASVVSSLRPATSFRY